MPQHYRGCSEICLLRRVPWGLPVQAPDGEAPFGFSPEAPLLPAQAWTKQDIAQDYAFRPYYGEDPEHMKQGARAPGEKSPACVAGLGPAPRGLPTAALIVAQTLSV